MSKFLSRLNEVYRPTDPVQDRVIFGEDKDFDDAFGNFLNPFLLNQWFSQDALARSVRLHTENGVRCEMCGEPMAFPVTVNGELQPFEYHPTRKNQEDEDLPRVHPHCEARF